MRNLGAVVILGVLFLGPLLLPGSAEVSTAALNARIVQLEEQLRQAQRDSKICAAQLTIAAEPQQARAAKEKLDAAAKDMGCTAGVDWNANPPVCMASKVGP